MKVKEEYRICNRCKERINEHWHKLIKLTRFKRRLILGAYVSDVEYDLCPSCTEKFERFMDREIDDEKQTEYDRYQKQCTKKLQK